MRTTPRKHKCQMMQFAARGDVSSTRESRGKTATHRDTYQKLHSLSTETSAVLGGTPKPSSHQMQRYSPTNTATHGRSLRKWTSLALQRHTAHLVTQRPQASPPPPNSSGHTDQPDGKQGSDSRSNTTSFNTSTQWTTQHWRTSFQDEPPSYRCGAHLARWIYTFATCPQAARMKRKNTTSSIGYGRTWHLTTQSSASSWATGTS